MISLRLAVAAVLIAAVVAGCITYLLIPAVPPVEPDQLTPPTVINATGRFEPGIPDTIEQSARKEHIEAFERAAEAILRRAQNATASAGDAKPPAVTTGPPVPLPRPRPLPRSVP